MRKNILLLVIVTSTLFSYAQTNDYQMFTEIERLLKKVEGHETGYAGTSFIINEQTFGYNSVSYKTTTIHGERVEEVVYTNIVWPKSIKKLDFWGSPTEGVNYFFIPIKENLNLKRYKNGKLVDNFSKEKQLRLYCLPEDREQLIKLFKKLLK